ncbi:MAG TPA: DUF5666 domain-containing protein [Gammaproteobacteria bacterium]|nr:DUF5666 domain-containing protein [Gammaproteobacteria bacterium]
MNGKAKAAIMIAILSGALASSAVPASATYAVTVHSVTGKVQKTDANKSSLTVNGLTILVSSQTKFVGISGLYTISRGMTVTVRYYNHPGSGSVGTAIEIRVSK